MVWKPDEKSPGRELVKIWALTVPYTRGRVLDVGSGPLRLFKHWITLDDGSAEPRPPDVPPTRIADHMTNGARDLPFADNSFDAVVSSHFIEHIQQWQFALAEWWRIIKPGGHLVLYWPHPDHYPRVGQPGASRDHKADIRPEQMLDAMRALGGWDCVEDETRTAKDEYSQFQVYRKRRDLAQNYIPWRKPERSLLITRWGALGDQIIVSSALPLLKAQGWTITYGTTPHGFQVVEHDPHIDRWLIQDTDQVENESLGEYVKFLEERYDRIINLSESIEGSLLTLPGRVQDTYPDEVRRKLCNRNYLEFTHDICGLPYEFRPAFYATDEEIRRVKKHRQSMKGPVILWILSGSISIHKAWPFMHRAIVQLLHKTDASFVLAGDARCQELERIIEQAITFYFGNAKDRVVITSGRWPVRGTMAFAKHAADVVVGPETGVLNAVAMEDVPKVVFMSHSSEENLTKHWRNVYPLLPDRAKTPCYPCHRLHADWSRCHKDEKAGTALCQANISVEQAIDAIERALEASMTMKEAAD